MYSATETEIKMLCYAISYLLDGEFESALENINNVKTLIAEKKKVEKMNGLK